MSPLPYERERERERNYSDHAIASTPITIRTILLLVAQLKKNIQEIPYHMYYIKDKSVKIVDKYFDDPNELCNQVEIANSFKDHIQEDKLSCTRNKVCCLETVWT